MISGRVYRLRLPFRYQVASAKNGASEALGTPGFERAVEHRRGAHTKTWPATSTAPFALRKDFISAYASKPAPFGFNGLGELVYQRTYARPLADGSGMEQWHQTVERVRSVIRNIRSILDVHNGAYIVCRS
jgi:hypothetical protein